MYLCATRCLLARWYIRLSFVFFRFRFVSEGSIDAGRAFLIAGQGNNRAQLEAQNNKANMYKRYRYDLWFFIVHFNCYELLKVSSC